MSVVPTVCNTVGGAEPVGFDAGSTTRDRVQVLGLATFARFARYLKDKTGENQYRFHGKCCQNGSTNGTAGAVEISKAWIRYQT
jgi:hypothetical protein